MQIFKQFLYGKWTVVTVVTLFFLNFSRVLGARIMRAGIMRTYLRSTREKFTFFSVTTVTVQKNKIQMVGVGGGCFPKYSRVPHTRSTRDEFIFYPPPTPTLYTVHNGVRNLCVYRKKVGSTPFQFENPLYIGISMRWRSLLCPPLLPHKSPYQN